MAAVFTAGIDKAVGAAAAGYYRLVLVVGPVGRGKTRALQEAATRLAAPLLNVNLLLSERIISLPASRRALSVSETLANILEENHGPVAALDNIEILFDAGLKQDPLRLLQSHARNRTLIASWPGHVTGDDLTYAEPGHPEYRRYHQPDALLVSVGG